MRRWITFIFAFLVVIIITGFLWWIYFVNITGQVVKEEGGNVVLIESDNFNLPLIRVNVGDSVLFENVDTKKHTVSSSDLELNSPVLSEGEKFSHIFNKKGIYSYYCKLHPNMTGQIIVN